MASSGMLPRVALVRTDVSEVLSAFNIRMTRIGELGTTLAVTSNRRMLRIQHGSIPARSQIMDKLMRLFCLFGMFHSSHMQEMSLLLPVPTGQRSGRWMAAELTLMDELGRHGFGAVWRVSCRVA
jgi:hypothetical protein